MDVEVIAYMMNNDIVIEHHLRSLGTEAFSICLIKSFEGKVKGDVSDGEYIKGR